MATAKSTRARAAQSTDQPAGAPVLLRADAPQPPMLGHGDADTVVHTGSRGAMCRFFGREIAAPDGDAPVQVNDAQGLTWELSGRDPLFLTVRRPRTAAEREAWIDWHNQRYHCPAWFAADRLQLCRQIAIQLQDMAERLVRTPRPRQRRRLQRQLSALGAAQWALVTRSRADLPALRRELSAVVGVEIQQPNFYAEASA